MVSNNQSTDQLIAEMEAKIKRYHDIPTSRPSSPSPLTHTELTLPTSESFNSFYDDFVLYKTPLTPSLSQNNILTLRNTTPNTHQLTIGIYAIIELLADKFKSQLPLTPSIPSAKPSPLPDFDKLDSIIQQKMWNIKAMFTDIYQHSDERVLQECQKYHDLMSIPLTLRLQFLTWEKTLLSTKVQNGIIEGLKTRDAQLEHIRKDYQSKYESEKISHRTEIDQYKRDTNRYRTLLEQLKARNDELSAKLTAIQDDMSTSHQKIQDAEKKAEDAEAKYCEIKFKFDRSERELKKFTEQPWELDATDKLTFFNKITGEIITYPPLAEFKKSYAMTKKEDDKIHYSNGHDTFIVPESLVIRFKELTAEIVDPATPPAKPEKSITSKLAKNDKKVLEAIKSLGKPTQSEIAEESGINIKHISMHVSKIKELGLIKEITEDIDGKKVTRYIPL